MGTVYIIVWVLIVVTHVITAENNETDEVCTTDGSPCKKGLFLPIWTPQEGASTGEKVGRAFVYLIALFYMFLGVSIVADRFMAAIEMITSKEKQVVVKKITGEEYRILVRVWNETVSNLTLMALGSSAPEILLSIIEICGNNFEAGALGPGTIVGSAAFNMFVIIGICIVCIPDGESRSIKHIFVFWVTVVWSIFAYIWLYMILAVITPDVVDLWEGLVTFLFFPLTVLTAYMADRQLFGIFGKRYTERQTLSFYGSKSLATSHDSMIGESGVKQSPHSNEAMEFERHRGEFIQIFKRMRAEHPDTPIDVLEQMAEQEVLMKGPKSRAFYRIQATRKLIGAGNVVKKRYNQMEKEKKRKLQDSLVPADYGIIKVSFDPCHYTCLENVGTCYVNVSVDRNGVEQDCTVQVDYKTNEGSASSYTDFMPTEGTLKFGPDENNQRIGIGIVDNDVYEEDEFFFVKLSNAQANSKSARVPCKLVTPINATVMIIDNDHAGAFGFENEVYEVSESAEEARIKVIRSRGSRGSVYLPYKTVDGTAKANRDYKPVQGMLHFKDEQSIAEISVEIVNDDQYEKKEDFTIELGAPEWDATNGVSQPAMGRSRSNSKTSKDSGKETLLNTPTHRDNEDMTEEEIAKLGQPVLADISRCKILIQESKEFKSFVDKLVQSANTSLVVGTSSWKQQFREALSVQPGSDDDSDSEGGVPPTGCFDYFMHALTLPWKLLFACIPPTNYWGGWLCFVVSISMIGLMTALIGDLASHFGCSIGLKDAVTAISLVALGTSIPDTFASKVAAVQDSHADSSVGNVTGSNAVNVYLGIGIAWALAAVVHKTRGTIFRVKAGSLAFSVTIFCIGAVICVGMLQYRRYRQGGELGGSKGGKYFFGTMFVLTWITYLTLSSLESYCLISFG